MLLSPVYGSIIQQERVGGVCRSWPFYPSSEQFARRSQWHRAVDRAGIL